MLKLIIGKAGAGKTSEIIKEIKSAVKKKRGGIVYIVPEQFSHEAERELSESCGPTACLYAEVMSFTGLARRVSDSEGGSAVKYLDDGGKLLSMALAVSRLSSFGMLRHFKYAAGKCDVWDMLVSSVEELKATGKSIGDIRALAEQFPGSLGDKLLDLADIIEGYDAVTEISGARCGDRLFTTAEQLKNPKNFSASEYYIDGFTDFTPGELAVIGTLIKTGKKVTVCLTTDDINSGAEPFAIASATGRTLSDIAASCEADTKIKSIEINGKKTENISLFPEKIFTWSDKPFAENDGTIRAFRCGGIAAECELAASEALRLVRETGCRWRDIAVAVRGFSDYKPLLKSIFEFYGVPLFVSESADIMSKPLPMLLVSAFEVVRGGWKSDDVISYMRSGLTGLTVTQCDELENYIFKWQLDERSWRRCGKWKQHPDGYRDKFSEADNQRLARVNEAAVKLSGPLMAFTDHGRECTSAREHCENLSKLMEELRLNEAFAEYASKSGEDSGRIMKNLWNICVGALEQCEAVLGDTEISFSEFGRLFERMLSKYKLTTIPLSLDRVSAGDFDRMRRRNISHLIILGASDSRLPASSGINGVFSESELEELSACEFHLDSGDNEVFREFTLIYNCLSQPSKSLTLSFPGSDANGEAARPSFVLGQASRLFGVSQQGFDIKKARLSALNPAMSLALSGGNSAAEQAAENLFNKTDPQQLLRLKAAASSVRGSLSETAVDRLYGKEISLSASRTQTYASCRFKYFCRYGLYAEPYAAAAFQAPEIGTFLHSIFEKTAREVKKLGGFKKLEDEKIREVADKYMDEYIANDLDGFSEKSERFIHLFTRLKKDVYAILSDAARELRASKFEPVDFELNFAKRENIPRYEIREGDRSLVLSGIADRVDAYEKDGTLYLRVVDYKSGKKEFRLGDVYNGEELQLLLYLMALEENGPERYGKPVKGAGVYYFPARNEFVDSAGKSEEKIESEHIKNRKRKGVMLDDPAVLAAWDTGEEKYFSPVDYKDGAPCGDKLLEPEQMKMLQAHVKKVLLDMSSGIRGGKIDACPVVSGNKTPCDYCDYCDACNFVDGEGGEQVRYKKSLKPADVWDAIANEMSNSEGKENSDNG